MTLGLGRHTFSVGDTYHELSPDKDELTTVISARYNRTLSGISQAQLTLAVSPDCCAELKRIRTIWCELRIKRNNIPVWSGPIVRKVTTRKKVRIVAFDLLWWLQRRFLESSAFNGQLLDAGDLASLIVTDTLGRDLNGPMDVAMVDYVRSSVVDVVGRLAVDVGDYDLAYEQLRNWAKTQLDYTMVNRALMIGNPPVVGRFPDINIGDIVGDPEIDERGDRYATDVVIIGADGTTVGIASVESVFGISVPGHLRAEHREIVNTNVSQEALQMIADEFIRSRYPSPVDISMGSGTYLSPKAEIDFEHLVPGMVGRVNLDGYCAERTSQESVITDVSVQIAEGGSEQIGFDVEPVL